MGENNNKRFLIDNGNQKFKMHKSGKQWMFKRITELTFALGASGVILFSENNTANADNKDKSNTTKIEDVNSNNNVTNDDKNQQNSNNVATDNKNQQNSNNTTTDDKAQQNSNNTTTDDKAQQNSNNTTTDDKAQQNSNNTTTDDKAQQNSNNTTTDDKAQQNSNKTTTDDKAQQNSNNVTNDDKAQQNSNNVTNDDKAQQNSNNVTTNKQKMKVANRIADLSDSNQQNANNDKNKGKYEYSGTIPVQVYDDKNKKTKSLLINNINPFYGNANTEYTENIDDDPATQKQYLENLGMGNMDGATISGSFNLYFDDNGNGYIRNNTLKAKTSEYKETTTDIQVNLHDEKSNPNSSVTGSTTVKFPVGAYVGQTGEIDTNDQSIISASNGTIPDFYTSGKQNLPPINYTITKDGVKLSNGTKSLDMYSGAYYNNVNVSVPVSIQDSKHNYMPQYKSINTNFSGYAGQDNIPLNFNLQDIVEQLNSEYNLDLPNNCSWGTTPDGKTGNGPALVSLDDGGNPSQISWDGGNNDDLTIVTPNYNKNVQIPIPKGIDIDPVNGYSGSTVTVPTKNINGGSITITVNNDGTATVTNTNLPPYTNSANVAIPIIFKDQKDGSTKKYNDIYYQNVSGYEGNPVTIDQIDNVQVINDLNKTQGLNLPSNTTVSIDSKEPLKVMIDNAGSNNQGGNGHIMNDGHIDAITPKYENNVPVTIPVTITDKGGQYSNNGSYQTTVSGYDGGTYNIPTYDNNNVYKQIKLPDGKELPSGTITNGSSEATINGNSATANKYNMNATTPDYVTTSTTINVTIKDKDGKVIDTKPYQTSVTGYVGNNVQYNAGNPHDNGIINQLNLPKETFTNGNANVHINSNNSTTIINDSVVAQNPANVDNVPVIFHVQINNPNKNDGNPTYFDYKNGSTVSGWTGNYADIHFNNDDIIHGIGLTPEEINVANIKNNGINQVQIETPNSEYDGIIVTIPKYENNMPVSIPVTINDKDNNQQYPKTEYYNTTVSGYDGTSQSINSNGDGQNILNNLNGNNNYKKLPNDSTASGSSDIQISKNGNYSTNNNNMNVITPDYINVPVKANVNVTDKNGKTSSKTYNTNASGYANNPTNLNPNSNDVKKQLNLPTNAQISGNPTFIPTKSGKRVTADGNINASLPIHVENVPVNIQVTIHDSQTNKDYQASYQASNISGYTGDSQLITPNMNDVQGKLVPTNGEELPSGLINNGNVPSGSIISNSANATINPDGKTSTISNDKVIINTPNYLNKMQVKVNVVVNNGQGQNNNESYTTTVSGYAGNDVTINGPSNSSDVINQLQLPTGTSISKNATVKIISDNNYTYNYNNNSILATDPKFVKLPVTIQVPVINEEDGSTTYKPYNTFIQGYVGNESENTTPDYNDIKKQLNLPDAAKVDGIVNGFINSPSSYSINSTIKGLVPAYKINIPVVIPVNIHDNNTGKDSTRNYNTTVNGYNGTTQNITPNSDNVIKKLNLPSNTNVSGNVNVNVNNDKYNLSNNTTTATIQKDNDNSDGNNNNSGNITPDNNSEPIVNPNSGESGNNINNSNNNSSNINNNGNNSVINKHNSNEKLFTDIYLNIKKPLIKINVPIKFITKNHKVVKYSPRKHPIFRLLGIRKLNHGKAIFKVSMRGTRGTFTTKMKNVPLAYYTSSNLKKHHANYVMSKNGDFSHNNKNFRQHRNNGLKRGEHVKVLKVVKHGEITRFKLGNGHYLTSNKYYVKLTTNNHPEYTIH
ncbi:DUF5776 domain-containing protein [Apilactobacillus micheneri]|uniref:DUF5776 domain-containing protein n=1 Tax=Apilactobacillus micheneri TaxID=1899430 RepID=UPI00112EF704|nr:DUF5776 domain-containing protein [Apilactobacillus micheneri]TPR39001.1 hypothetical protein DY119_04880 [Apilactobacillus micheneri]